MPKVLPEYLELRRQQILDAAAACFSRRGFHQTTMQDICTEAGLSPGADAVDVAHIGAGKGVDHPMEADATKRGVHIGRVRRMDGQFDVVLLGDGYHPLEGVAEAIPPFL